MRGDGTLRGEQSFLLEDVAAILGVETIDPKRPGAGVGQRDERRVGPHDPLRAPQHRGEDVGQLEVRHERIRELEQERQPILFLP